jgi:hypothetical protein
MGHFGLLRPDEYLAPTTTTVVCKKDPLRKSMTRKDVAILNDTTTDKPVAVRVFINRSKTNRHGEYINHIVKIKDNVICPVTTLRRYLQIPGVKIDGPLFILHDKRFVTLGLLDKMIKRLSYECGHGVLSWSTYGLRIGGAMSLANAGVSASYLKKVGRWKSNAYLIYIRDFSLSKHAEIAEKRSRCKDINAWPESEDEDTGNVNEAFGADALMQGESAKI